MSSLIGPGPKALRNTGKCLRAFSVHCLTHIEIRPCNYRVMLWGEFEFVDRARAQSIEEYRQVFARVEFTLSNEL